MKALIARPLLQWTIMAMCSMAALTPAVSSAERTPVPAIDGKTLSGKPVKLPSNTSNRPTVLIFGFDRSAKEQSVTWGKELIALRKENVGFDFYQVAILSGAPRFTHGFISRAIRSDVPTAYQSHFLLLANGAKEWRNLLQVTDEGVAYVVLCSPTGELQWRTRGVGKEQFDALRAQLRKQADE